MIFRPTAIQRTSAIQRNQGVIRGKQGVLRSGVSETFDPLSLNPLLYYDAESSMLADGGGAAAQGDSIATLDDLSANSIDATQSTALNQPVAYDADNGGPFARFDGSNDRMTFTLASPIVNGTVFFATKKGSYAANIDLAAGAHNFSGNKLSNTNYNFANDLVALLLFDFVLSQSQIDQLTSYFSAKGAVEDYGGQTNLTDAWRESDSLTSLYPIDASAATNLTRAWFGCGGFLQFPLIPTPLSQSYNSAWRYCVDMTDFPAGFFDDWNPSTINNSCFRLAWFNCPSLTHQSVENILVSIDTSGKYASSDGTILGIPIFEPNIDIFYDNSGLTAATTTAITNLKNKGWIITINGTPQ